MAFQRDPQTDQFTNKIHILRLLLLTVLCVLEYALQWCSQNRLSWIVKLLTGAVELLVSVLAITHENVVSMNRFSACLCQTCGCESGMGADNVRGAEGAALRGDSFGIVVGLISCARSARCAGCASNPSACKIGISWIRCASSAANCARARIGTGLSVKCESAGLVLGNTSG